LIIHRAQSLMEQSSSLNNLTIDVLANTTLFLINKDIQHLYMTGDSLLQMKMRNGGVSALKVEEEPFAFVSQFPKLRHYVCSNKTGKMDDRLKLEWESMPSTLTSINWMHPVQHFGMFAKFP
jgi:hypothetical protein